MEAEVHARSSGASIATPSHTWHEYSGGVDGGAKGGGGDGGPWLPQMGSQVGM